MTHVENLDSSYELTSPRLRLSATVLKMTITLLELETAILDRGKYQLEFPVAEDIFPKLYSPGGGGRAQGVAGASQVELWHFVYVVVGHCVTPRDVF